MTRTRPIAASVIIPSHNRSVLLRQLLDALGKQEPPLDAVEVIVVADGCKDDTLAMLAACQAPFPLLVREAAGVGPAEARNIGAAAASGDVLIFLDDDVIPEPGFVRAHLEAHRLSPQQVVLGPYPPFPHASACLFRVQVRTWWTKHFERLARPGHRFSYRDLLTGNLSLSVDLWNRIGGLDPQFRHAREDLELGVRLISEEISFRFAPDALGYHHEYLTMSVEGSFRRAFEEGRSDVRMGLKHLHVRPGLRAARLRLPADWRRRLINKVLFVTKGAADPIAWTFGKLLDPLQRSGFRSRYLRFYYALNHYWYLRGVSRELGTMHKWREFTAGLPATDSETEITIDLKDGIEAAEERLDVVKPRGATLLYGGHPIGTLRNEPGSERWQGRHLRLFLAEECGPRLLRAMAIEGDIVPGAEGGNALVVRSIEAGQGYYGCPRPADMWIEQYAQWKRFDRSGEAPTPDRIPMTSPATAIAD